MSSNHHSKQFDENKKVDNDEMEFIAEASNDEFKAEASDEGMYADEVGETFEGKSSDAPKTTGNVFTYGSVSDCIKLNVRAEPKKCDNVILVIPFGSAVQVDLGFEDPEFYHIFTAGGIEGYCVKKFIQLPM